MYLEQEQNNLIDLTAALLKEIKSDHLSNPDEMKLIEDLRTVIHYHDWKYYVQSENVITDFEYDQLFSSLKKLEASHPESITADSPTQRVSLGITKNFTEVQHLVPMLSLDNSYNAADLIDWDKRVRDLTRENEITYCIEPKFDGAGISVIYENDLLIRGATRGDGSAGEEITNNIKVLRSIPLAAKFFGLWNL